MTKQTGKKKNPVYFLSWLQQTKNNGSHLPPKKQQAGAEVMNIKAGYQVIKSCYDFLKKWVWPFIWAKLKESPLPKDALCQV